MKKSKKQQRIDELRESDVLARIMERQDIDYGEHTELPKGENVALIGRKIEGNEAQNPHSVTTERGASETLDAEG